MVTSHTLYNRQIDADVSKHLESLKTRLGFAKFKLRNGWEKNTLLDVESFWKERQRQMIDELPTPRFTQRDILDNRTLHPHYHYHQSNTVSLKGSPDERQRQRRYSHHSQTKNKKAKFTRSHSTPTASDCSLFASSNDGEYLRQKVKQMPSSASLTAFSQITQSSPSSSSVTSTSSTSSSTTIEERHYKFNNYYASEDATQFTQNCPSHQSRQKNKQQQHIAYTYDRKRKRMVSHTPPSPPADEITHQYIHKDYYCTDTISKDKSHHSQMMPQRLKNSLEYLSYAIAMTENQQNDSYPRKGSVFDAPDSDSGTDDNSVHYNEAEGWSTPIGEPPSSPVTAAAEAMMMFGHHTQGN